MKSSRQRGRPTTSRTSRRQPSGTKQQNATIRSLSSLSPSAFSRTAHTPISQTSSHQRRMVTPSPQDNLRSTATGTSTKRSFTGASYNQHQMDVLPSFTTPKRTMASLEMPTVDTIKMVDSALPENPYSVPIDQLTNDQALLLGRPIPPQKSALKPVYPFTPYAVDPDTGEYALRPGLRNEGVINIDTPLARQSLEYKRRIVNSYNNVVDPNRVIGDPSVYQSRVEANFERTSMLFDDDMRPFLNRHTRVSPIYRDSAPELRTPRTPLPADTGTSVSPTAGVLHAYRMHFVRMYLHHKKRKQVWDEQMSFDNVYNFDSTLEPIKGAGDQEGVQEFMHYVKGVACARNSNFVPTDTIAYMSGIKKILPLVAKVDEVKVVHIRRRKK